MFHILNPFPHLLTYNLFAPIILRVVLGYLLITFGYAKVKIGKSESIDQSTSPSTTKLFISPPVLKLLGIIEIIVGIAFIIGLGIQIDSIIAAAIFLGAIIFYDKIERAEKQSREIYVLAFIISLSLLLSGAGLLAIDLPL